MNRNEFYFTSGDGSTSIHTVEWQPDTDAPVAIVQIVHGMAEHMMRYEQFAHYLNEQGVLVVGDDHLGHGKSLGKENLQGYFARTNGADILIEDEYRLTQLMRKKYPNAPYIILGHSMGSFIVRNYLCRHGADVTGAIIMGTGMIPKGTLSVSKTLVAIQKRIFGDQHKAIMIDRLAFGSYNKRIPQVTKGTPHWLTKEADIVKSYVDDDDCGFVFTLNGFSAMFELIWKLHDKAYISNMPKDLPVLFVSGKEDPVGDYGKAVKSVYESFQKIGMNDVRIKLYENDRHEILNETDREQVYKDLWSWIAKRSKR